MKQFEVGDGNTIIESIDGSQLALAINDISIAVQVFAEAIYEQFTPLIPQIVEGIRNLRQATTPDYDIPWDTYSDEVIGADE